MEYPSAAISVTLHPPGLVGMLAGVLAGAFWDGNVVAGAYASGIGVFLIGHIAGHVICFSFEIKMSCRCIFNRNCWIWFACALIGFVINARDAWGLDRFWTNLAGGNFTNSANWQNNLVPGPGDKAIFDRTGQSYTVDFTANVTDTVLSVRSGDVTFNLGGKTYQLSGGPITTVGETGGIGALTLTNGLFDDIVARIATHPQSQSTVTVSGTGMSWTNASELSVGYSGRGKLIIANGASITCNALSAIGSSASATGNVTVNGAGSKWTNKADLTIGDLGKGELVVADGGTVSSSNAYIGRSNSALGTVTVSGIGSTWANSCYSFYVGYSATGVVTVKEGGNVFNQNGFIGTNIGSHGAVTVNGAGSLWANHGTLHVGYTGSGTLVVENGGNTTNVDAYLGERAGSTGTAMVTGASSTWNSSGNLIVGELGNGTLTIADAGLVKTNGETWVGRSTGQGAINFAHGTLETGSLLAGVGQLKGAGTINAHGLVSDINLVFDQSHGNQQQLMLNSLPDQIIAVNLDVDGTGAIGAGYDGQGTLGISEGAVVKSSSGYLGYRAGSNGSAIVSGAGTAWSSSDNLVVGDLGFGNLAITDAGLVEVGHETWVGRSAGQGAINFAQGTLATGSLLAGVGQLKGAGTVNAHGVVSDLNLVFDPSHGNQQQVMLNNLPNQMITINLDVDGTGAMGAGYDGQGALAISAGSVVKSTSGYLGYRAGSNGAATISGANSTWSNSSNLTVGESGSGSLTITAGGRMSSSTSVLGKNQGSQGMATVRGVDSNWTNSSYLYVGESGAGSLKVEEGGNLGTMDCVIGYRAGSQGSVTVSGTGSIWNNSTNINIGVYGVGTLTVADGGAVLSNSNSYIGTYKESQGSLFVRGTGSTWSNNNKIYVGYYGIGTLSIADGGTMTCRGCYVASEGGGVGSVAVSGFGSTWKNNGNLWLGFSGKASMAIEDGASVTNTDCYLAYRGPSAVKVSGSHSIWTNNGALYVGGSQSSSGGQGLLEVSNSGKVIAAGMTIWPAGTLTGSGGTVQANVSNRGLVAPGAGACGTLLIDGNYIQDSTGKLAIDIAAAASFDRLSISGQASLRGTLQITLLENFVPTTGTSFDILDWNSRTNTFSSILLPALPGGRAWDTSQLYISGVLSVTGPAAVSGDFDSSGVVDSVDLMAWQAHFPLPSGGTLATGDADGDGDVDGADFVVWQTHFGAGGGGSSAPVPEPDTALMALAAIVFIAAAYARRKAGRIGSYLLILFQRRGWLTVKVGFIFAATAFPLQAAISYDTIALTGDAGVNLGFGPNLGTGIQFKGFTTPVINAAGHIAFAGLIEGTNVHFSDNFGIWTNKSGPLEMSVRTGSNGSQGPNLGPNFAFSTLNNIGGFYALLNDQDKVVFVGSLTGTGITQSNDQGIWNASNGSVNILVREGAEPGPGLATGVVFRGSTNPFIRLGGSLGPSVVAVDNTGSVSFLATVGGTGISLSNDLGVWRSNGAASAVAREGTQGPGPGLDSGVYFDSIWHEMLMNPSGQTTFGATLSGAGLNSSNNQGIWTTDGSSLTLIARSHPTGPGPNMGSDIVFSGLTVPRINAAGNVAFRAWIAGPGIDSSNEMGIWTNVGGALAPVAREGTVELGPNIEAGVTFANFNEPFLDAAGDTVFAASLQGPGIDASNDAGLWMHRHNGALVMIAREGANGPGLSPGLNFNFSSTHSGQYVTPFINANGEIVFTATLTGDGVSTANNQGLWAWADGNLIEVVRTGEMFDVNPDPFVDDFRVVAGLTTNISDNIVGSGGGDGRPTILNDNGLLTFGLIFADGSEGIFTAQLPREPGDFDGNGVVDSADLVAWQAHFPLASGGTLATGDADGDGDVDGADFVIWQTHFLAGGGGASTSVPEPAGATLILCPLLIVVLSASAHWRKSWKAHVSRGMLRR